jgi:hypothetical protein
MKLVDVVYEADGDGVAPRDMHGTTQPAAKPTQRRAGDPRSCRLSQNVRSIESMSHHLCADGGRTPRQICRSRGPCEYAERARTRAQIIPAPERQAIAPWG